MTFYMGEVLKLGGYVGVYDSTDDLVYFVGRKPVRGGHPELVQGKIGELFAAMAASASPSGSEDPK